ncbi:hypothetical protein LMG33818_001545 [Halomonadaceae bacterium LMG 33818]
MKYLYGVLFSVFLMSPLIVKANADQLVQYPDGLHVSTPGAGAFPTAQRLAKEAPGINIDVLALALSAMRCAQAHGQGVDAHRLAVIDYSRSSRTPRLWVFDLPHRKLLFHELVAHGSGSGGDIPDRFSNKNDSHASSLGLYLTGDTYQGHNGISLRMDGLEPGYNSAAMERDIVLHGATYVNGQIGSELGRLGRSWGCPAVPKPLARPIIDVMKDGQFLFAYYPEKAWLLRSSIERCAAARLAQESNQSIVNTLAER